MLTALLLQAAAPADPAGSAECRAAPAHLDPVATERGCRTFGPERTYDGIYVDAFEGQLFGDDGRTLKDAHRTGNNWITLRRADLTRVAHFPEGYVPSKIVRPMVYRVRFRGAEPVGGPCRVGQGHLCYGHMGMSPRLIVADVILSASYIGDLPLSQER